MSGTDYGARLDAHQRSIEKLEAGQTAIFGELKQHGSALTNIATTLTELRAQRGPAFKDILDVGTRVIVIFTALVAGIVYLSSNAARPDLAAFETRMRLMERDLGRHEQALEFRPAFRFRTTASPPGS